MRINSVKSFNQSGGITAGKVNASKEKNGPKILNNPWMITILGGLIVSFVSYLLLK